MRTPVRIREMDADGSGDAAICVHAANTLHPATFGRISQCLDRNPFELVVIGLDLAQIDILNRIVRSRHAEFAARAVDLCRRDAGDHLVLLA